MGQGRINRNQREQFLQRHPFCIYCGARATTKDHCPPKCFFEGRRWPETYEFAACYPCNHGAGADDQAMALLIRIRMADLEKASEKSEWEKLVRGVNDSQPQLVEEWAAMSRNRQRHSLREAFGTDGDSMRREGWGAIYLGPRSREMISRFMVRLSKALYYKYNGVIFDGVIYARHISGLDRDITPASMAEMVGMAPGLSEPQRNNQLLIDQFLYRYNHSSEHGTLYAVVQFSEQFIFQLIVLRRDKEQELAAMTGQHEDWTSHGGRYDCPLVHKPAAT